jgi:hypothetical protein
MTIAEMHIAVKLVLDKTSALELPAFEPEEIDFWLNKGIRQFVDNRYSGYNSKQKSVEENQRITDDLRTIINEMDLLTSISSLAFYPNAYSADVTINERSPGLESIDYLHRLGEEVLISYTDTITNVVVNKRQGITECTSDNYRNFIDNPYSEHRLYLGEAKPLRLFIGNLVELITDGNYSISSYYLRYLKNPTTVSLSTSVNCDLPVHTHDRIVDLTVSMMLENIESQRYQGFEQKRSISE